MAIATTCLLLSACGGSSSKPTSTTATTTTPRTTNAPTTGAPRTDPQALLARVSLQQGDLAPGATLKLFDGGNEVAGQVTLDLCGGSFPSEALRRFRHQVGVDDAGTAGSLSTEAVIYSSAAAAAQARSELQNDAAHCPPGFVTSTVEGEPPLKYTFGPEPDAGWATTPAVSRFGLSFTVTDEQGHTQQSSGFFQVRDRLVVILYVFGSTASAGPLLASSLGGVHGAVDTIARRMAAVTPAQLAAAAGSRAA